MDALTVKNGHAERIVVYSGSDVFRCASNPDRLDNQCLLKLASTIIHEAWHYRHGPDEAGAYDAQIAFLITHGGSSAQIAGVRRSRATSLPPNRPSNGGGDKSPLDVVFTTYRVHVQSSDDDTATPGRFAIHG